MTVRILDHPSPNSDARGTAIDMVVLHYTGMRTAHAALDRLCDPAAKVSAHYLVDEDGTVRRLVDEERRAWHAGVSSWHGATDINARSVGIEIVNPGHEFGYRPFPGTQMDSVEELLAGIVRRHDIDPARVVGHSDVAPTRKQDPGEMFDWRRLARAGLAIWPDDAAIAAAESNPPPPEQTPALLARIGYDPATPLDAALRAFQRRFLPDRITGGADAATRAMLAAVAALR